MITNEEKIDFIKLKIIFYAERLQESIDAIEMLKDLGNQLKIDSNNSDIDKYGRMINILNDELESLTNQG